MKSRASRYNVNDTTLLSLLLAFGEQPRCSKLRIRTVHGLGDVYRGDWDIRKIGAAIPHLLNRKAGMVYSDKFNTVITIVGSEGGILK